MYVCNSALKSARAGLPEKKGRSSNGGQQNCHKNSKSWREKKLSQQRENLVKTQRAKIPEKLYWSPFFSRIIHMSKNGTELLVFAK